MILDSSAIVALLFREPDWDRLMTALETGERLAAGAPTLAETGVVLVARGGAGAPNLHRFLQEFDLEVISFGDLHWAEAMWAYERFGRRRHPAQLNFGDCLTYATAKLAGEPLLCKGNDFSRTDLDLVPY